MPVPLLLLHVLAGCAVVLAMPDPLMASDMKRFLKDQAKSAQDIKNFASFHLTSVIPPLGERWDNLQSHLVAQTLIDVFDRSSKLLDFCVREKKPMVAEDAKLSKMTRDEVRLRRHLNHVLPNLNQRSALPRIIGNFLSSPTIAQITAFLTRDMHRRRDFLDGKLVDGVGKIAASVLLSNAGKVSICIWIGSDEIYTKLFFRATPVGIVFKNIMAMSELEGHLNYISVLAAPQRPGDVYQNLPQEYFMPDMPVGVAYLQYHDPRDGRMHVQITFRKK